MDRFEILAAIDAELERLRRVRELLQETEGAKSRVKQKKAPEAKRRRRRTLSPEGLKRIAEAQRRRWAMAGKNKAKGGGGTGDGGYGFTSRDNK
jgi:hypothetical protein